MHVSHIIARLKPTNGRSVASVLLTLPAFFAIGMHIILLFDPASLPAVPGMEDGWDSLRAWFGLLLVLLYFAELRFIMGVLCFSAAGAYTAITYQWAVAKTYASYEGQPWKMLTSETGLWYLAAIGVPLLLGILWAANQNATSIKQRLNERRQDGIAAWLLAVAGLLLAYSVLQRPTVHDYADQYSAELDALEERLIEAASVITLNYLESGPAPTPELLNLDPAPVYIAGDPKASNLALIPIGPFQGGGWHFFTNRWSHVVKIGPLTELLANRHAVFKNELRPIEPYKASIAPAWWLLYDDPSPCYTDSPFTRFWLVRASDGRVMLQITEDCSQDDRITEPNLLKKLTTQTNGTFSPPK